ncbi:MAG: hypothetical protein RI883_868 [Bacteroidota bacterium]|jgi:arsenate reductase
MADSIMVFHNSRCSKSRCALEFLTDKGIDFTIVDYLKNNPTHAELEAIVAKLRIKPEALIRKGEEEYKLNFKDKILTDSEWIEAMVKFPKLIERPIVIKGNKAIIGRPTERILEIL